MLVSVFASLLQLSQSLSSNSSQPLLFSSSHSPCCIPRIFISRSTYFVCTRPLGQVILSSVIGLDANYSLFGPSTFRHFYHKGHFVSTSSPLNFFTVHSCNFYTDYIFNYHLKISSLIFDRTRFEMRLHPQPRY